MFHGRSPLVFSICHVLWGAFRQFTVLRSFYPTQCGPHHRRGLALWRLVDPFWSRVVAPVVGAQASLVFGLRHNFRVDRHTGTLPAVQCTHSPRVSAAGSVAIDSVAARPLGPRVTGCAGWHVCQWPRPVGVAAEHGHPLVCAAVAQLLSSVGAAAFVVCRWTCTCVREGEELCVNCEKHGSGGQGLLEGREGGRERERKRRESEGGEGEGARGGFNI